FDRGEVDVGDLGLLGERLEDVLLLHEAEALEGLADAFLALLLAEGFIDLPRGGQPVPDEDLAEKHRAPEIKKDCPKTSPISPGSRSNPSSRLLLERVGACFFP